MYDNNCLLINIIFIEQNSEASIIDARIAGM